MRLTLEVGTISWRRLARSLVGPALVLGIVWVLWSIRSILAPFAVGFFLASLLDPVVANLEERGVSRSKAVGLIFGSAALVLLVAATLLMRPVISQIQELAENSQTYGQDFTRRVDELYERYKKPLASVGISENPIRDRSGPVAQAASLALQKVRGFLSGLGDQALWLVIVPLSLIYFLLEYSAIRAKLISFVPNAQRAHVNTMAIDVIQIFSDYIRGLTKVCALYGVVACVIFAAFGLNYWLFLGIASGVLYAVPYLGVLISFVATAIIALTMGKSILVIVLILVLLMALQFGFDNVITPKVVGGAVGLHPLVNIFALMCGATLFGLWGMLLAVPVAASIQRQLVYFYPWLAEPPIRDSSPAERQPDEPAPDSEPTPKPTLAAE